MDTLAKTTRSVKKFAKDSHQFLVMCEKPTWKEFSKLALGTTIGFCIMGFIGFFVKLVHIPINNIIVGS
ncbi:protein transport protein Sec61 subunit gamma [Pelomyxa schiedti]|nr:protein transport protein Sec61 subunit gamma [Pelomyxa schiedti]